MPAQTKHCLRCEQEKPLSAFSRDRRRRDGIFPYCMSCQMAGYKRVQDSGAALTGRKCGLCFAALRGHPNRRWCSTYCKTKANALRKKYDLSPEDWRALIDDAEGKCPICRAALRKSRAPVDHNHRTMEVTGIVCTRCNVGLLAYSNHDPEIAQRLANFLRDPPAKRVLGRVAMADPKYFDRRSALHNTWKDAADKYESIDASPAA